MISFCNFCIYCTGSRFFYFSLWWNLSLPRDFTVQFNKWPCLSIVRDVRFKPTSLVPNAYAEIPTSHQISMFEGRDKILNIFYFAVSLTPPKMIQQVPNDSVHGEYRKYE